MTVCLLASSQSPQSKASEIPTTNRANFLLAPCTQEFDKMG